MPEIEIEPPACWPELRECEFKVLLEKAMGLLGQADLSIRILHQGAENPDRFLVYVLRKAADGTSRHVYAPSLPALSKEMLAQPHLFGVALIEALEAFMDDIRQDRLELVEGTADRKRERAIAELSQKLPF
jgi:hypothetical protein